VLEKWEEDILAIEIASVRGEIGSSKVSAVVSIPSAVDPGSNHQGIENAGIVFVD